MLPLFPLHTVLFPGGYLPLRIFEPRYVGLVSDCVGNDREFGVCLIREGSEVGTVPSVFGCGTLARIEDWNTLPDGLLSISARGGQRFAIRSTHVRDSGLLTGEIDLIDLEPEVPLPEEFGSMREVVLHIINETGLPYADAGRESRMAAWTGYRLAELLPFASGEKQRLLELQDPVERLRLLRGLLEQLRNERPE